MRIWIIAILCAFGLGFMAGMTAERASLGLAEDKTMLTYEGSIYVRAIEAAPTLENYLTAAGKKR